MTILKNGCCVDFSDNADAAFKTAMEMAKKFEAKFGVVHVRPTVVDPILINADWSMPPEGPKKTLISNFEVLGIGEQPKIKGGDCKDGY